MRFVALDFETANSSHDSICQIGVVTFDDCCVEGAWQTLVNPQDEFDGMNVSIHGITPEHVKDAPTFPAVFDRLSDLLTDQIVVHHSHFDKLVLARGITKHRLREVPCTWLDTTRVARRAWPEFAKSGYGLKNLAKVFEIDFQHHAAHEDARAAGEILVRAIKHTRMDVSEWLVRVEQPIVASANRSGTSNRHACHGTANGPLFGETIVFTGTLTIARSEAAMLAAQAGCNVGDSVTKKTTMLVVGDQDARKLSGKVKSNKHQQAEKLVAAGQVIRILTQSDFECLIAQASPY